MQLEKVTKTGVADAVFEQMKQMLLSGAWKSGDRIAGENELARQLGVSRLSVREAIHRLIGMGVLTVRHGDGTYVSDSVGGTMQSRFMRQLLLSTPQLDEVLEFRMMAEVGAAGLAARRATPQDVLQLRELEQSMAGASGGIREFARYDLAYHNAIAVISGNSLLSKIMAAVQDVYAGAMLEAILVRGMEAGRFNHRPITDAIAAGDGMLAEALMREHIQAVIKQVKADRPSENP